MHADAGELNGIQIPVQVGPAGYRSVVAPDATVVAEQHSVGAIECHGMRIGMRLNSANGGDITPRRAAVCRADDRVGNHTGSINNRGVTGVDADNPVVPALSSTKVGSGS